MKNGNIKALKINNAYVELDEIPHVAKNEVIIHFLSLGAFMYVIYRDIRTNVMFIYVIEQEIANGRMRIKDITSITEIKSENVLADYFQYNHIAEQRNLINRLPSVLSMFAFDLDVDYMISKITEYLSNRVIEVPKVGADNTRTVMYKGETYTLYQLAKKVGIDYKLLWERLRKGMSVEEAVTTPVRKSGPAPQRYTIDGESYTVAELSKKYNISTPTLRVRIRSGMSIEEAITCPDGRKGNDKK